MLKYILLHVLAWAGFHVAWLLLRSFIFAAVDCWFQAAVPVEALVKKSMLMLATAAVLAIGIIIFWRFLRQSRAPCFAQAYLTGSGGCSGSPIAPCCCFLNPCLHAQLPG